MQEDKPFRQQLLSRTAQDPAKKGSKMLIMYNDITDDERKEKHSKSIMNLGEITTRKRPKSAAYKDKLLASEEEKNKNQLKMMNKMSKKIKITEVKTKMRNQLTTEEDYEGLVFSQGGMVCNMQEKVG